MTTIAYRDGVLAVDSQCTRGDLAIPGNHVKVHRLKDGSIYAFCGLIELGKMLHAYLDGEIDEQPLWKGCKAMGIVVQPDRSVWIYEGGGMWFHQPGEYGAWGSGEQFAYGAMAMGADAKQAVKASIKFDTNSGGPVRAITIDGQSRQAQAGHSTKHRAKDAVGAGRNPRPPKGSGKRSNVIAARGTYRQ